MPAYVKLTRNPNNPDFLRVDVFPEHFRFPGVGVGIDETAAFIEGRPLLKKVNLSFRGRISGETVAALGIPIVQAHLRSAATELDVEFLYGAQAPADFLAEEASKQAITSIRIEPENSLQQNLTLLGMLKNLGSFYLTESLLSDEFLSTLSKVRLSDYCRKFVIGYRHENPGIESRSDATELVKFLQLNNQMDDLELVINSVDATQIIATHLEGLTRLRRLKWTSPFIVNNQKAQRTSLATALSSIEFIEGVEFYITGDQYTIEIIKELAPKMTKGNRELSVKINDLAQSFFAEDETFSSFLRAAIGSKSNLQQFNLETFCVPLRLSQVALALESALPNLSPKLRKLRLVTKCNNVLSNDEITAFKTRILAALEKNVGVLALQSFDLVLETLTNFTDSFDQDTVCQFRAFAAKKSIQRMCFMTDSNGGLSLAALPKALDQIRSNPHISTKQFSATMLFHCLRNNKDLQEKAAMHLVQTKKNRKRKREGCLIL